MARVRDGMLVLGPWRTPLSLLEQQRVDAMKMEAASQDLATLEIRGRESYELRVSLTPNATEQQMEAPE
jgi:hypothetical protein